MRNAFAAETSTALLAFMIGEEYGKHEAIFQRDVLFVVIALFRDDRYT